MNTKHYDLDRGARAKFIEELGGAGLTIDIIHNVDKGHWNGLERHEITENGIIRIFNEATGQHITDLIARPEQILRYYTQPDLYGEHKYPKGIQKVLRLAKEHTELGFNYK